MILSNRRRPFATLRRETSRRETLERGIATIGIAAIVTAVVAAGGGVAYVATDGFGTQSDEKPVAASEETSAAPTATPTSEPTEPETSASPTETSPTDTSGPQLATPSEKQARADKSDRGQVSAKPAGPKQPRQQKGLPKGFPNIGVPFYSPTTQMAAHADGGGGFILEYVTPHELTIVNMFFRNNLAKGSWTNVSRTVNGQTTVTKATSRGYSLVVAVLPERADDSKTSIHYTLRKN